MNIKFKNVAIIGAMIMMTTQIQAIDLTFGADNIATEECKMILQLGNIEPQQIINTLDKWHLFNVALTLQTNGCFQEDCDFYKNGNESEFSRHLTLQQAEKFLDLGYLERAEKFPRAQLHQTPMWSNGYFLATGHNEFICLSAPGPIIPGGVITTKYWLQVMTKNGYNDPVKWAASIWNIIAHKLFKLAKSRGLPV